MRKGDLPERDELPALPEPGGSGRPFPDPVHAEHRGGVIG